MTTIILIALTLALFQYWLIPVSTKLNDMDWATGTRDEPMTPTKIQARIERAASNLKESLPAFLALCLLSMIQNTDITLPAIVWLVLRVLYIPCYMYGINPARSIVWVGSLLCLIFMAVTVA